MKGKLQRLAMVLVVMFIVTTGCSPADASPAVTRSGAKAATGIPVGMTAEAYAALASLEKVSDFPLYTMHYAPAQLPGPAAIPSPEWLGFQAAAGSGWSCSLFAALGNAQDQQFGRNFDWQFSPALLLFYTPQDGYASVSMVDIAYLKLETGSVHSLDSIPVEERVGLLAAPLIPFDGMNAQGLAVGMAAVPPGNMEPDPAKPSIGSLGIIRRMLDGAKDVTEALAIFDRYHVDMGGGPPVHYLLADRSGAAILLEFYNGERVVTPTSNPWHLATNFLVASTPDDPSGQCWRYDTIAEAMREKQGALTSGQALDLLLEVSQENTQWSVVYNLNSRQVQVVMGKEAGQEFTFELTP